MAAGVELTGNGETIDLQQQVARLQALLEASRHVHSTTREEEVLEQVLRIVVRELEMAGAAFPSAGMSYGEFPADGVEDSARAEADGDFAASTAGMKPFSDTKTEASVLAYPLDDREGRRMTELLVAPPDGRGLTIYEADFIEGLALQAAVALENARNHKRNVEFARVQQDMDAARAIQRSLLPQKMPAIAGYSLAFRSDTCYEVGGDYLDIVEQPDGSILMAVADVAVIGLPDPKTGERACAVVAVAEGHEFDFATMGEYLRARGLRVNAVPEQLELVDVVPRNPAGKILKHTLRERFAPASTAGRAAGGTTDAAPTDGGAR